jgi:energy-coupling factor transporter ATP-binding protein EcfA2
MDFEFPGSGVHVISATNGSGKTTLLVCMERIVNTRAFNQNFIQHPSPNIDSFDDAKITYEASSGRKVTYTYRKHSDRWNATTNAGNVLKNVYSRILFMPTLGNRVYIKRGQISGNMLRSAGQTFRQAMSEVLEDDRFNGLLKGNVGETRGRMGANRRENTAYFLPIESRNGRLGRRQYHSESTFSLGEIFVLNLLYQIQNMDEGSLLLVDELEVALHPRVQYRLLRYLEQVALERNLTVLVSTHSSSIIKCAKNLVFIEKEARGVSNVIYNCYPTYALREVAIMEDISPDYVFYVEDDMAERYLRHQIDRYFQEDTTRVKPIFKVLPVGGYPQVLAFGKRSRDYLLPNYIGQYLFLDKDVVDTKSRISALGNGRTEPQQREWELFNELETRTRFLNITPELGLWEWLLNNTAAIQRLLAAEFPDRTVELARTIQACNVAFPTVSANPRKDAKKKMNWMSDELGRQLGLVHERFFDEMFRLYCTHLFTNPAEINTLRATFGPIFSRRGNPS